MRTRRQEIMNDTDEETFQQNTSFEMSTSVLLCMDCSGTLFGCSLLKMEDKTLYILQKDIKLNADTLKEDFMRIFHFLNLTFDPNLIYVSTRVDGEIKLEILNTIEERQLDLKMDTISTSKFNKTKIIERFATMKCSTSKVFTLLTTAINSIDSAVTLGTVSCLVEKCLDQIQFLTTEEELSMFELVTNIEYLSIDEFSFTMDEETIYALTLLPEKKTRFQKSIKNGTYSLFELLGQYVYSEKGKQLLKTWILNPLKDVKNIYLRSSFIECVLSGNALNKQILFDVSRSLNKMPNIYLILNSFEMGKSTYSGWVQTTKYLELIITSVTELKLLNFTDSEPALLTGIFEQIDLKDIKQLHNHIQGIVDVSESNSLKQIVIQKGVNSNLDEYKEVYSNLEDILENSAKQVNKEFLQICAKENLFNVVYIPQLGYLLCLDYSDRSLISEDSSMRAVFQTDTHVYYKNELMLEMDANYGDIYTIIQDMEIEIIQELQNEVVDSYKTYLIAFSKLFAELEVLISWSLVSFERGYSKPIFTSAKCLSIEKGRHPIHESLVLSYIPNDLELTGDVACGIITGANMSGKSNYLITCGLNVLMAQIGCFVASAKTTLSLADQILTRIWSRESLIKTQSTFVLDSQQMAKCISICSESSLILIDEFGKGTDVLDGPSLFGAVIQHLTSTVRPRVLACTHYHELFGPNILSSDIPGVSFYCTQVVLSDRNISSSLEQPNVKDNQLISFLYKVKKGISRDSYGIICAEYCGMKETIVQRAKEISDVMSNGGNIIEHCFRITDREVDTFATNEKIATRFLNWDLAAETSITQEELAVKLNEILHSLGP